MPRSWISRSAAFRSRAGFWSSVTFSVRYCRETAAVTSTGYRVHFHGDIYNILSIDPMNYQRKEIRFICRREARP